jgi:hypothetical protein
MTENLTTMAFINAALTSYAQVKEKCNTHNFQVIVRLTPINPLDEFSFKVTPTQRRFDTVSNTSPIIKQKPDTTGSFI